MRELIPAETFPPGEFIKEELEARNWTQDDLADILGRPLTRVNDIINGKSGLTPETAKGLGDAFGTGAQFWLNLESAYRLSLVRSHSEPVKQRAELYSTAPVRLMIKRNWIESSDNIQVLEKRIIDFFYMGKLGGIPPFYAVTRKSAAVDNTLTTSQNAWLYRARHLAKAVNAVPFTDKAFKQGLERLHSLLPNINDIRQVPRLLSESGVRLLVIEPLPQTRIDGACFWLDSKSPVVVLSVRYDRIDWFWHTLLHELGHVNYKDGLNGSNNIPVDTDLVGEQALPENNKLEFEKQADQFAIEFLVPQTELSDLIARISPLYSKKRIDLFANRIKVHPGIVVGQLQHRKELSYAQFRETLVKIRQIITESALTDGWGYSLPSNL